jgi:hypothetical protein
VRLFRRREPAHVQLAREAGLDAPPGPVDTRPWWGEVGIHGVARPREWDAVATVEADLPGERAEFVALDDATLVIEEGPDDVAPLAEAVERSLAPPYRAEAVRRADGTWAVAARRIRIVELPDAEGDELELTIDPDGMAIGRAPALEPLLDGPGVATARRIDGDLWEVKVDRL